MITTLLIGTTILAVIGLIVLLTQEDTDPLAACAALSAMGLVVLLSVLYLADGVCAGMCW